MIASQEETTTVGLGGSVGEEEPGISSRVAVETPRFTVPELQTTEPEDPLMS